ncbi:MAG: TIGR02117 family protein [Rhodobacteraceae bacterium]|nr:TIGR02117 family protein [Paracoccaceae bacterium]
MKGLAGLIGALAAALAGYLSLSLAGAIIPGQLTAPPLGHARANAPTQIMLVGGPIHYDILLPATPQVRAAFSFAIADGVPVDNLAAEWISVGWGSEAFFMNVGTRDELTFLPVWYAVTGDSAVIRLGAVGALPADLAPVHRITLSQTQLEHLTQNVLNDMRSPSGQIRLAKELEQGEAAAFYHARGDFNLFRTCNTWISKQMRAAGLRFGIWTPAPYSVRLSAWWFGHG